MGVLKRDCTPRTTTLDILGVYLGYRDWKECSRNLYPVSSPFYKTKPYIDVGNEDFGCSIEIGLGPGAGITP